MKVISFVLLISIIFSLNLREKNIEKTIDKYEKNETKKTEEIKEKITKDYKKKLSRPPKMKKESVEGSPERENEKKLKKKSLKDIQRVK